MSTLLKNLLIALSITLLLVLVYMLISKEDDGTDAGADLFVSDSEVSVEVERALANIRKVEQYNIEAHDDILTDRRFTSLEDRRVAIPEQEVGRENPFAPVQ